MHLNHIPNIRSGMAFALQSVEAVVSLNSSNSRVHNLGLGASPMPVPTASRVLRLLLQRSANHPPRALEMVKWSEISQWADPYDESRAMKIIHNVTNAKINRISAADRHTLTWDPSETHSHFTWRDTPAHARPLLSDTGGGEGQGDQIGLSGILAHRPTDPPTHRPIHP